jgi:hypothetical protein
VAHDRPPRLHGAFTPPGIVAYVGGRRKAESPRAAADHAGRPAKPRCRVSQEMHVFRSEPRPSGSGDRAWNRVRSLAVVAPIRCDFTVAMHWRPLPAR